MGGGWGWEGESGVREGGERGLRWGERVKVG